MFRFKGYVLESTFLEIQNMALTSREPIIKFSGHSIERHVQNRICTQDLLMCTLKAYMLKNTIVNIDYIGLRFLKVSGNFVIRDL